MIAASEPQEYTPFGRQQIAVHPGAIQIGLQEHQHHIESALTNKLSEVDLSDNAKVFEVWMLREAKSNACDNEEELYHKGKTAVWSVGPGSTETTTNRTVECCYTLEMDIKQAFWCNLHLSMPDITASFVTSENVKKTMDPTWKQTLLATDKENSELKNCICILDENKLSFFTSTGKEYKTALQFQVTKVWPHKYGLLLERKPDEKEDIKRKLPTRTMNTFDLRRQSVENSYFQKSHGDMSTFDRSLFANSTQYLNIPSVLLPPSEASSQDSLNQSDTAVDLPTVFSLCHPLDEICPVVCKHDQSGREHNLSYISNHEVRIVMTSESPSICVTVDMKTGLHSVYMVRKALPQESEVCLHRESMMSPMNQRAPPPCTSLNQDSFTATHHGNISLPAFLNARTRKSLGLSHSKFLNHGNSPLGTYDGARHSSPLPSRSYGNVPPLFTHNHYTPSPRRPDSPLGSAFSNPTPSRMMTEDLEYAESKPLYPQVCLQLIWSQPPTEAADMSCSMNLSVSQVSTAFLTTDLTGQMFLCFVLKTKKQLSLYKVKKNDDESCVVFGDASVVPARDAVPLDTLRMIAIVNLEGGVELYSGAVHVAKLAISGVLSSFATVSHLTDSQAGPGFFKPNISSSRFPKRSSLLPQSAAHMSPVFNESLSQLSPVTSLFNSTGASRPAPADVSREGALLAVRDPVATRLTLEYASGQMFRVSMPELSSSPLVQECLSSVCRVLSSSQAMQFSIKWYTTRNAPGSKRINTEDEFALLTDVLLGMIGYDLGLLKGTKHAAEASPVTCAKKPKTSTSPSDDDWLYLLGSQHHAFLKGSYQTRVFKPTAVIADVSTDPEDTPVVGSGRSVITPANFSTPLVSTSTKQAARAAMELIEETPVQSKPGKSRIPANRFQMHLNRGDASPAMETCDDESQSEPGLSVISKTGSLYNNAYQILFTLHLLYEDMKLNELKRNLLPTMVVLLYRLAVDLNLPSYARHYWYDFPHLCPLRAEFRCLSSLEVPQGFSLTPPNILKHIHGMLDKKQLPPYPYLPHVNTKSKNFVQLIGLLSYGYDDPAINLESLVRTRLDPATQPQPRATRQRSHRPIPHRAILLMSKVGITQDTLQTLPPGVAFIIFEALYSCRDNPGLGWSKETYRLAMRHDLASLKSQDCKKEVGPTNELVMPSSQNQKQSTLRNMAELEADGMEDLANLDVLKLRFSSDQRVLEARRMLQSAQPVQVAITQRPDVSDHEFIQEQEKYLYAICTRTMALSVGRGMVTLRSATPVVTEKLPIPTLCLTGREPTTDKIVDMTHIELLANTNVWPLFHNGVAAGLRISHNAPDIDSHWILYNKPKTNNDELIEHAGFLMALGLNGHLDDLRDTSIYQYLMKFHEMTSVGLLLGVSASKRGTMDLYMVKIVSIHVQAMLPPTGIELDIDVVVEPAALVSLGFLYQNTAHRHISQVLLQEIGRPPGPEMENSVDRESYALAAGLALGLVIFGKGDKLSELGDMAIPDTLHHFMVGGPKRPYLGSQHEKYKTPSFLIWEGDLVNTHVTGPGATLALGMFYFNTGNRAVAEWLKVPETQHLLEMVLPDALLLRTLARGLIMWEEIETSKEWVLDHIPAFVRPYCLVKPNTVLDDEGIDYETMNQAYCNIVAGACMAMGLKCAGSAHEEAFETLMELADNFTALLSKSIAELCGKSTIETCLNVITVSLAMVMCGTGDIRVLRLIRFLRSRVGPANAGVTYGSHLATHMALGLLFLGGGAYSLSTSPDAIAALLCAFYPKWPLHSNDNRYHLQALRHLYVLAVEPRVLLCRDIDSRTSCYIHVTCVYLEKSHHRGQKVVLRAPCILSELSQLKEVRIDDSRYWSIVFKRDTNWKELETALAKCCFIEVKQKAGCLSYLEDPHGFRSLLAQTLTSHDVIPWNVPVESICAFSSDPILMNLTQYFLEGASPLDEEAGGGLEGHVVTEEKIIKWLTYICYHCLTKDRLCLLPVWVSLLKHGQSLLIRPTTSSVWNLKLMWTLALRSSGSQLCSPLLPPDMALSIKQFLYKHIDLLQPVVLPLVHELILGSDLADVDLDQQASLTAYLTLFDLDDVVEDQELVSLFQVGNRAAIANLLLFRDWSAAVTDKLYRILQR